MTTRIFTGLKPTGHVQLGNYLGAIRPLLDLVADPSEPVAVRCFSMTAAAKIAKNQPSLMGELKLIAENQLEHATAGMRVRIGRLVSGK